MAKKLLSVWLSLTILIFSSISIYADEVIQGDYFLKNIVINGENIVNYELSDPFFLHNDRIYVPMNSEVGNIMGFVAEMDNESRTLKILKTEPVQKNLTERSVKNNLEEVPTTVRTDIKVVLYQEAQNGDASLTNEQANVTGENGDTVISVPNLTVSQIDLMGQPVLVKDTIVYVPLNAIVSYEPSGWSSYYENYSGVYISTDDEIDTTSYFKAADSASIEGRFIVHINPNVSMNEAANMVRYFDAYGRIYGVDPKLLMAVAQCESTYYTGILNSSNCARTDADQTFHRSGLRFYKGSAASDEAEYSDGVDISRPGALTTFNGDRVKALSSDNWGMGTFRKDRNDTKYAEKVLSKYDRINSFLTSEGYL